MESVQTPLRAYQKRICDSIAGHNSLVILPTGAGKTLIACQHLLGYPGKRLFLVPMRQLVHQQQQSIERETGLVVVGHKGGTEVTEDTESADVLVATPAAFLDLKMKRPDVFGFDLMSLIIFDEVHHLVKEHPYRLIANEINTLPIASRPSILGLTAHLTYSVKVNEMRKVANQILAELTISKVEKAEPEELDSSGYFAHRTASPIILSPEVAVIGTHDSKESFFKSIEEGTASPFSRQLYYAAEKLESDIQHLDPDFKTCLASSALTMKEWGPYAHERLKRLHPWTNKSMNFLSHEQAENHARLYLDLYPNHSHGWEIQESCIKEMEKPMNGIQLREQEYQKQKQKRRRQHLLFLMYYELEHIYEALKITLNSLERATDVASKYLQMTLISFRVLSGEVDIECEIPFSTNTVHYLESLYKFSINFYGYSNRLLSVKKTLLQLLRERGDKFRGIIFVQERITTHVLHYFVQELNLELDLTGGSLDSTDLKTDSDHPSGSDEDTAEESNDAITVTLNSGVLYASSSPASASFRLSPSRQTEVVAKFASGHLNLLISTNVSEEGMDISETNCVIRFDPIQTPVSYIQGKGRARAEDSSIIHVQEYEKKNTEVVMRAQEQHYEIIDDIVQNRKYNSPPKRKPEEIQQQIQQPPRLPQTLRDVLHLLNLISVNDQIADPHGSLHRISQKHPGCVREYQDPGPAGLWNCVLVFTYGPNAEDIVTGNGTAQGKTSAKRGAANDLLRKLRAMQHPI